MNGKWKFNYAKWMKLYNDIKCGFLPQNLVSINNKTFIEKTVNIWTFSVWDDIIPAVIQILEFFWNITYSTIE